MANKKKATEVVLGQENTQQHLEHIEEQHPLDSFVYMDDTIKLLDIGFKTDRNVLLFGPGGHGKSDLIIEVLKTKGIQDPYVMTMGTGTTTDRLFGGLDLKAFNASGKIEYFVENSFMNYEYVVFEELFDAPDFILEQLKDILSSKVFRNGTQTFPIKTKMIICASNRTRQEFAKNASLSALMERFPLEHEVKWKNYNKHTYEKLLQTKLGYADPMLTSILDHYAANGIKVSPRIAIVAAQLLGECGPDCLAFIAEFQQKPDLLTQALTKFKDEMLIHTIIKEADAVVKEYNELKASSQLSISKAKELNKGIKTLIDKFSKIKVSDSLITLHTTKKKELDTIWSNNDKEIVLLEQVEGELA